jgi:hypothetical protein
VCVLVRMCASLVEEEEPCGRCATEVVVVGVGILLGVRSSG